MLSKNKIKLIQSLERKKIREKENSFLVEGNKLVLEALQSGGRIRSLVATTSFIKQNSCFLNRADEVTNVTEEELQKASLQQSPQQAIAIMEIPEQEQEWSPLPNELSLALDGIQDPGNMGTIIRIADWFGITNIICSGNTVDCYNPKVVQSSMGAIFRVVIHYCDLPKKLLNARELGIAVFGTFLEGENIYAAELNNNGILVMGNEGNGICPETEKLVSKKIHIPAFPSGRSGSESLNVATATAVCCAEFRRRLIS